LEYVEILKATKPTALHQNIIQKNVSPYILHDIYKLSSGQETCHERNDMNLILHQKYFDQLTLLLRLVLYTTEILSNKLTHHAQPKPWESLIEYTELRVCGTRIKVDLEVIIKKS